MINNTKEKAGEVLRRAVPGAIRVLTAGVLDVSPLVEAESGQMLAAYAEDKLAGYEKGRESIETFRDSLREVADNLFERQGHPLIVMIDELDRCRPSYTVELLEVAKHLFSVPQIVFILAINRIELAHSIKSLYGNEFDADGYLRRFFDIDFRLPDPDRSAFIDDLLKKTDINDYFQRTQDREARHDAELTRNLLQRFFGAPDLSLRRIAQAIHRLGLVFASLRSDHRSFMMTALVAIVLRTIDADVYHRFRHGNVSDLEVADAVFSRPEAVALRAEQEGCLFEAAIIVSAYEIMNQNRFSDSSVNTPLYRRYQSLANPDDRGPTSDDPASVHAGKVLGLTERLLHGIVRGQSIGFLHSARRIELLSKELVVNASN